jgi:hypothetical protein
MNTDATRVHYGLVHATGKKHSVAILPKSEWSRLLRSDGGITELVNLPRVLSNAELRAAEIVSIASGIANPSPGLMIARYDPNDAPNVINVDRYTVIENLVEHPIYFRTLSIAGVSDTPEIRDSLRNCVFFVKEQPDPNFHWFQDFPKLFTEAVRLDVSSKFNHSLT